MARPGPLTAAPPANEAAIMARTNRALRMVWGPPGPAVVQERVVVIEELWQVWD
ncbi:MAG: hypothetical protein KatS3mg108_0224 [Isosphaeraceae bacterium]|jgi:hypothetical protein|nr:MAG: hypothetical protein KatS3mg108_0224 [Isosphaeraceae bacterium]